MPWTALLLGLLIWTGASFVVAVVLGRHLAGRPRQDVRVSLVATAEPRRAAVPVGRRLAA